MPRKPRLHVPGCLYHVISRGNNRQAIFREAEDYKAFLGMLERTKSRKTFRLYAYCLMPNHFHLLIEAGETPVSVIMQRLLTAYTHYFNRTWKCKGHLFQGRHKAIICDKDAYLLELSRYIHLNPVRAGLVKTPAAWQWSGYGEYIGKQGKKLVSTEPVLVQFSEHVGKAVRLYMAFVRDGMGIRSKQEYYPKEAAPYIGGDRFIEDITVRHLEKIEERPEKSKRTIRSLSEILSSLCESTGICEEAILHGSRTRSVTAVRKQFIQAAFDAGHPAAMIARFTSCSNCYITKVMGDKFNK